MFHLGNQVWSVVHFDNTVSQRSHKRSPDVANFAVRFAGLTVLRDLDQAHDEQAHVALVQFELFARLQNFFDNIYEKIFDLLAVVQANGDVDYVAGDDLVKGERTFRLKRKSNSDIKFTLKDASNSLNFFSLNEPFISR